MIVIDGVTVTGHVTVSANANESTVETVETVETTVGVGVMSATGERVLVERNTPQMFQECLVAWHAPHFRSEGHRPNILFSLKTKPSTPIQLDPLTGSPEWRESKCRNT